MKLIHYKIVRINVDPIKKQENIGDYNHEIPGDSTITKEQIDTFKEKMGEEHGVPANCIIICNVIYVDGEGE